MTATADQFIVLTLAMTTQIIRAILIDDAMQFLNVQTALDTKKTYGSKDYITEKYL